MANSKVREKRREQRRRQNEKLLAKAQDDQEVVIEDDLEEDDVLESPVEAEKIEKDYDYGNGPAYAMAAGPVSWEESEAEEVAREQAREMREVTYTAEALVSNILYSQMPSDSKAGAIKKVGDGLGKRLKAVSPEKTEKSVDMDLLEVRAIIAKDSRHTSVIQKVGDWVETRKSLDNLSDEDFAYVNGTREFPVHDAAHVRSSLKLAAKMIEDGEDAEVRARQALLKIKIAAKVRGVGTVDQSTGAVLIEKDKEGNWRAVMWPSNNFIDTDKDIISDAAHTEYVDWVNKNMDVAPVFMCHHIPGTLRKSRVDFVGYESGFLIMSAPLEEHEAAGLLRAQAVTDLGMSHGTIVLERNQKDKRVIEKYRMVEVSDLPLDHAANPFTDFETLKKEADMNTKEYLVSVLGSETEAEKYLSKMEQKQKSLREQGIEEKSKSETTETAPPAPKTEAKLEAPAANIEAVIEAVKKELGIEELGEFLTKLKEDAEKVPVLEQLVKELAKNRDEVLAEAIDPPASKTLVWMQKRASQSDETILKEKDPADEKLKKSVPDLGWLSEATQTTPVAA